MELDRMTKEELSAIKGGGWYYDEETGFYYDKEEVFLTRCYADKENCVVVNYNGDVFKCTANDFLTESREGILNLDGTIQYNDLYKLRMEAKYESEICQQCSIFPICPSCSQDRIRMKKGQDCRYKYDKMRIVEDQIKRISLD